MQSKNIYAPSMNEIFGDPDSSFRLGIFASSNSGKSYLISEMLTNPKWGCIDKFKPDHIFIVSPTVSYDPAYQKVIKSLESRSTEDHKFDQNKQVFDKDLESSLSSLYSQISEEQKSKKMGGLKQDHNLILLDDVALELDLSSQFCLVGKILVKCRHANISVILSCQHLRLLSCLSRNNLSHGIFFSCPNKKEIMKIKEELSGNVPSKQFDALYNFCTQEKYGYLLCVYSAPDKFRYFKGNGSQLMQIQV